MPERRSDIFVIFTVTMEILLEPTSNKLFVGDMGDSIWIELMTMDINLANAAVYTKMYLEFRQAKDHDIKFYCLNDIKSKIKILDHMHVKGTAKNSQDNKVLRLEAKDHDIKFYCSNDIKSMIKILDHMHVEGIAKNSQDNKIMNVVSLDVYMGLVYYENVAIMLKELNETYDKVDGSVVYNLLQKINIVKQGGSSVADYYQRINSLWREFDALTKLPKCTCDVKYSCDASKELGLHQQLMKLMQLLIGLDDCYQPVKISLLTRDPLPEVKDAYNVVLC
nr:putative Gag-polypeptide of LTR copia-type [Tanacetum cinerariifolium]